jgi:hypothetical protein
MVLIIWPYFSTPVTDPLILESAIDSFNYAEQSPSEYDSR